MGTVVVAQITAQPWVVVLDQLVLLDCVVPNGVIAGRDQLTAVLDLMMSLVRRYLDRWSVFGVRKAVCSLVTFNVMIFFLCEGGGNGRRRKRITSKVDFK